MTAILVKHGVMACDDMATERKVGGSYGTSFVRKKYFKVAGGAAIVARTGDLIANQMEAEVIFICFVNTLQKVFKRLFIDQDTDLQGAETIFDVELPEIAKRILTANQWKAKGLVIMTKFLVASTWQDDDEKETRLSIHCHAHPRRHISLGAIPDIGHHLLVGGMGVEQAIGVMANACGWVGRNVTIEHAENLKVLPYQKSLLKKVVGQTIAEYGGQYIHPEGK